MPKIRSGVKGVDPKLIRALRGPRSQREFAALLGASQTSILLWEAGRQRLMGPTATLLNLIIRNPDMMLVLEEMAREGRPVKCGSCGAASSRGTSNGTDAGASSAAG